MTKEQLDAEIAEWRTAITQSPAVDDADADELENHLREQIADLRKAGLSDSEAFQIGVRRLGRHVIGRPFRPGRCSPGS